MEGSRDRGRIRGREGGNVNLLVIFRPFLLRSSRPFVTSSL